ncbi:MAG TPA: TIM barrel protein [Terriglobales bacterium]
MVNRRDFLKGSAAIVGCAALTGFAPSGKHRRLGVQLYTVRDQAEKDLPGTLAAIKKIGYDEVETYWNVYTHPAKELKKMINDAGLEVHSGHFDYEGLESKLDYASELGLTYVICPMLPKNMWTSLDGFRRAADQFNLWGADIRQRGMKFGFHNHNYEFKAFNGKTGFDTLMGDTEPKLVCLEMDCYWITQAGEDPVAMMNKLGDRVKALHLKDREPGAATSQTLDETAYHFAPVGTGTINWKDVLATAEKHGITELFVEQDYGDLAPIEELRISYKNLRAIA